MRRRTEREEACCSVFSRVSGPCVKAATVVVCSSGCVVVVGSVGARELGLVGVGSVSQFVLQTWDWSFPFCPSSRLFDAFVREELPDLLRDSKVKVRYCGRLATVAATSLEMLLGA